MYDGNMNFGGATFGGYSPESKSIKHSLHNISTANQPDNIKSKKPLEKFKNIGSFSSITSLTDII